MAKKVLLMLLLIAVCAFTFAQSANETSKKGEEEITLSLYGPAKLFLTEQDTIDPATGAVNMGFSSIVTRWNELHPNVKLKIQGIGWSDWKAAIVTAVAGGDVDIILHGGVLTDLVEDLGPYVEKDRTVYDQLYVKSIKRTDKIEGKTLEDDVITCLLYAVNPIGMIIDKQIFADWGVELPDSDSYTWTDVINMASKMTGINPVTGKQNYGYKMRGTRGTDINKQYALIASAKDAKVFNYGKTFEDTTFDFTNAKTIEVFKTMVELAKYCSPDNVEGVDDSENISVDNDSAMIWTEDFGQVCKTINAKGLQDRFVLINLPVIEEGANKGRPSLYLGDNNIAINKYSPNKDWAWEFIKFLVTDEVPAKVMASKGLRGNTEYAINLLKEQIGEENVATIKNILSKFPDNYNNDSNDYFEMVSIPTAETFTSAILHELVKETYSPMQCAEKIQTEFLNAIAMN